MLRKLTFLAFAAILLAGTAASAQTVTLSIPELDDAFPGDVIAVPVEVSDLSGLDVLAFQFYFSYDASAVDLDHVEWSGVPEDWDVYDTLDSPGVLNMLGYDDDNPVEGGGTLATVYFRVRDDVLWGNCYDFCFDQRPCCQPMFGNGSTEYDVETICSMFCVPVRPSVKLQGSVKSHFIHDCYECDNECEETELEGIHVDLYKMDNCNQCEPHEGTWWDDTMTDANGDFEFVVTDDCDYYVALSPPCIQAADLDFEDHQNINSSDMWWLRRYLRDLDNLQYCPILPGTYGEEPYTTVYPMMVTSDLTADHAVNVFDASVLKQVIFQIGDPGYNEFTGELCWIPVTETERLETAVIPDSGQVDVTIDDFFLLLTGDINGSYGTEMKSATKSTATLAAPMVGDVVGSTTGTIALNNADHFRNGQFVLTYDPAAVALSNFTLSGDLEGAELDWVQVAPGRVMCMVLSLERDYSVDVLDLVSFTATMLQDDAESVLGLENALLNDGEPTVRDGLISTDSVVGNEDLSWGQLKADYR